jgi:hypothetical protein
MRRVQGIANGCGGEGGYDEAYGGSAVEGGGAEFECIRRLAAFFATSPEF